MKVEHSAFVTPVTFEPFPKMARLSREVIITEKIDGTNASIHITPNYEMFVGSRTRWITPNDDNFGFAKWCEEHKDDLMMLGPGTHFGEWWGSGIQRGYGLPKGERRFSLFNTIRWCLHDHEPQQIGVNLDKTPKMQQMLPPCCFLVPVLHRGPFDTEDIEAALQKLKLNGSYAAPFMNPEGIVVFHTAANIGFKRTIENDDQPKSLVK